MSGRSWSESHHGRNTLLHAMGGVLEIYVQSLVISFTLEALGDRAVLKNPDVRLKKHCERMNHTLPPKLPIL